MFGLAKTQQELTVVDRPRPMLVTSTPRLQEYTSLAKEIDFEPGQLWEAQIKEFLATNNIPVYNSYQVHCYMEDKAIGSGKIYRWRPLRKRDMDFGPRTFGTHYNHGGYHKDYDQPYDKAVPFHILKQVKQINNWYREAAFFVTDYAVRNPDPFICVTAENMPLVIFGVWDEPEFFSKGGN